MEGPVHPVISTQNENIMNIEIQPRCLLALFILWSSSGLVEEIVDDISEIAK